jgi:hypothetical protein
MTPSSAFDDDLLSAALDHELADDQQAAIDTDPVAVERLAELARARDAVADAVSVPIGAADRAIAAALAARTAASVTTEHDAVTIDDADDATSSIAPAEVAPPANGDTTNVVSLQARRDRRQARGRVLTAAAAVALLAVAGVAVWTSSNDPTTDQVATASDAPVPLPSSTTSALANESATLQSDPTERFDATGGFADGFGSTTTRNSTVTSIPGADSTNPAPATSAPASADIGDVVDATDLQAKVRTIVGVEPLAGVTTNVACAPVDPTELVVWSGTATHAGAPLSVQIRQHDSATPHIVGLDPDTCTIVFDIAR